MFIEALPNVYDSSVGHCFEPTEQEEYDMAGIKKIPGFTVNEAHLNLAENWVKFMTDRDLTEIRVTFNGEGEVLSASGMVDGKLEVITAQIRKMLEG